MHSVFLVKSGVTAPLNTKKFRGEQLNSAETGVRKLQPEAGHLPKPHSIG
jgi:hypothetical protein